MSEKTVFVIRNQLGQYLDKHSGWQSGKDNNALFRVDHRDEALNTLIEINAKDITLRGKILEVPADEKKRPVVEISEEALALDKPGNHGAGELFVEELTIETTSNETSDDDSDADAEETLVVVEEIDITFTAGPTGP